MKSNRNNISNEKKDIKLNIYFRLLRLFSFFLGIASIFWFFFSFIGILIGIIYFLNKKQEDTWRYNGLILAYSASISNLLGHIGNWTSRLIIAATTGPVIIFSYIILNFIGDWLVQMGKIKHKYYFLSFIRPRPVFQKSINLLLIIIPISLWSSVSIDLGVMFNNEPTLLWVHGPTTAKTGDEFSITIECWDPYERLSAEYQGTVNFTLESYDLITYESILEPIYNLPDNYTFTGQTLPNDMAYSIKNGKDNGYKVFNITIDTPGIHYLKVLDSITDNVYFSNPIIIDDFTEDDSMVYWGDIHTHSSLSDGAGTPEHNLYYGRNIACLDYMALTDHGEILMWKSGSFDRLQNLINDVYEPNKFVSFQGIEWTQVKDGHYTCIFSGEDLIKKPVLSFLTVPTIDGLWKALDDFTESYNCEALALPHHPTKKFYIEDWTKINPKYVKIAEVCSVHGDFLFEQRNPLNYRGATDPPPQYQNGTSIMDALKMGYKISLYGSSDVHDGHPGHSLSHTDAFVGHQRPLTTWHTRNEHPYPGGLTAVFANNLTRTSVFEGLQNQRIYAVSDHSRPFLNFTINGTQIGDGSTLFANSANDHREIKILLIQDGAPAAIKQTSTSVTENWIPNWNADIEILKNGELMTKISTSTKITNLTILDTTPITGAKYGVESCVKKDGNYYINEYSDNPIDPSTLNTEGVDFYIVRIVNKNGRHTYMGPIFVEVM